MQRSLLYRLSLVCTASALVPRSSALVAALGAAEAVGLLGRDYSDACDANSKLQQCSNVDFCCPKDTDCQPFNHGKSVMCCPTGQPCTVISPLPCDVSFQNATTYPMAPVHTHDFKTPMTSCGSSCCPVGYSCNGQQCILSSTATFKSTASKSTTSSTSSRVSKPTATSSTTTSTSSSTKPPHASGSSNPFPAGAVFLGLGLGLLLGIAIAALIFYLLRRRSQQGNSKTDDRYSADFMGRTPALDRGIDPRASDEQTMTQVPRPGLARSAISDPMAAPSYGGIHRTDFLMRQDSARSSLIASSHRTKPSDASARSIHGTVMSPSIYSELPAETPLIAAPFTPSTHARSKSTSDRVPMFQSPLRLVGLPQTPAPPKNVPQGLQVGGDAQKLKSGSPAASSRSGRPMTPNAPNLQPPTAVATATLAQRHPAKLIPATPVRHATNASTASHGSSIIEDDDDSGRSSHGARTDGGAAATYFSSPPSSHGRSEVGKSGGGRSCSREPSTETINVLMPAPDMVESINYAGERIGVKDYWGHVSTNTTFSAMMEGVGASGQWRTRQ